MVTRRGLLLAGLAGGTIVAAGGGYAFLNHRRTAWSELSTDPTVFLRIDPDNTVTLQVKHLEMGQGIMTGLSTLVAEELDADWSQMRAELAPGNQAYFKNGLYGRQATAASTSIHNSWLQMRQIGASARQMIVAAAASNWSVPRSEIGVEKGVVSHLPTGRTSTFGDLSDAAMAQSIPDKQELKLKSPEAWRLIGKSLPRVDGPEKVDGSATFSIDVKRPNMLRAVVARPPRFGAQLVSFDPAAAEAVSNVVEVLELPNGVAVLAENSWAAIKGREALEIEWDYSEAEVRSTSEMWDEYRELAKGNGLVASKKGNIISALGESDHVEEFEFTVPFLAHASLEPLNAVIELDANGAQVWAGCQLHTLDQWAVADTLGIDREKVQIKTPFTGSSFGRRAYSRSDWMVELAEVAKASQSGRPIQVLWTREDDLAGGVYRPMALHQARVGIDQSGKLSGWEHKVVCKSLMKGTPWEIYLLENGADRASTGGLTEAPYVVPNMEVTSFNAETPIPVGFWRSIGDSHNLFALETIMDDMALAAGIDPITFRLNHFEGTGRETKVLKRVAEISNWGNGLPENIGQGVALTKDHLIGKTTHVAMVAEVKADGETYSVEKIFVAVDCGIPINPNIIRTQVESSISFAISTVFSNAITHDQGIVEQTNFDSYEPTRMWDMPEVVVDILPTDNAPSGIGEAAVAPVAPAIVNAIFSVTGVRHRSLPIYG